MTNHMDRMDGESHMLISRDAEKAFGRIQFHFMIKALKKVGIESNYLNITKVITKSLQRISYSTTKH